MCGCGPVIVKVKKLTNGLRWAGSGLFKIFQFLVGWVHCAKATIFYDNYMYIKFTKIGSCT